MAHVFIQVFTILAFISTILCFRGRARFKERKCEAVTIPLCKQIGYNLTYMPNQFGHNTQFDAGLIIYQFVPLVNFNCSPLLKHFICSLYAPMCDPVYHKEILPCRSFCIDVRDKCEPVMKDNGFQWPDHLKCSKFPTRQENNICMKPGGGGEEPVGGSTKRPRINKMTRKPIKTVPKINLAKIIPKTVIIPKVIQKWKGGCGCLCKAPFVYPNKSQTTSGEIPPCALPCNKYFFDSNQRNFITFWLGLWAIVAFVATTITMMTFFLDRSKFDYTERPIILIAFCYMLVSLGYIVRLINGHESIACDSQTNLIRYSATGPAQCTAVFILTYFFTNVAWIWWVVLSMNWFLSTGLKWSPEAISCYSQYFHFIAWLIPTVQTMAILAMAAIDGDPVSGLCSVGNHNNNTLTIYVIAPLLIYSMLALSFFLAGVLALCQSKRVLGSFNVNVRQDKKPERYISKIGLFTFILLLPAVALLACHFYEHNNREIWEKSTNCPCMKPKIKPQFYAFLIKYFMSLMIGLVIGLWILEARTVDVWKSALKRVFSNQKCHRENNNLLEQHKHHHDPVAL